VGQARNLYTLLYDLKATVKIAQTDTGDDDLLGGFCFTASRMWEGSTKRRFYPLLAVRYYDFPEDSALLKLDEDLLEVAAFTTQNGEEDVASTDYYLRCGRSYNLMPYDRIEMLANGDMPVLLFTGIMQKSQAVTGYWGYNEDWSNAWQDSNDALAADALISATTLTVSDADGADIYGVTPRFKVGQLLRIVTGDDTEYIYLVSIDTATNVLTVNRGVNGTTAVAHVTTDQVDVYMPMGEVVQAVTRLAAWLYGQKDAPFTAEVATTVAGATITIPPSAPTDVIAMAAIYKRVDL